MSKEVILVYQDCYDCGQSQEWYKKQQEKASRAGITISPMPHNAIGAKGLILKAHNKGASTMPFLTDGGENFGYSIDKFIPKHAETEQTRKRNGRNSKTK